jgi:hypothetical protein
MHNPVCIYTDTHVYVDGALYPHGRGHPWGKMDQMPESRCWTRMSGRNGRLDTDFYPKESVLTTSVKKGYFALKKGTEIFHCTSNS